MIDVKSHFATTLKKYNYSLTQPRVVVFKALNGREPQTICELIEACGSQIDRASLYRTIALFEQLCIVQRLQIGWKYKLELSDAFSHNHHHHCSCIQCGQTIALPEDPLLEARLRALTKTENFLPQDHQLEVRGLCQACQIAT